MPTHRLSFLRLLSTPLCASAQAPLTVLHVPATYGSYYLSGLHTMVRADDRTLSLASGDTILITSRATTGITQWDAGISTPADSLVVIYAAELLDDGTIAACGRIGDFEGGLYLHLDTLGNVLAARRYQHNNSTRLTALEPMTNGHLRLVGITLIPFTTWHGLALEIDLNGDLFDATHFSIGNVGQLPWNLVRTADGGHVVTGEAWMQDVNGQPTFKYASLAKLDSTGQLEWAWRIHQSARKTFPQGIVELASGDLLFWVRVEYPTGSKPVLIKFSSNGSAGAMVQLDAALPSDGYLTTGGGNQGGLTLQGDTTLVMAGFANITANLFTLRIDTALSDPVLLLHDRLPGEWPEDLVSFSDGSLLRSSFSAAPLGGHCLALAYLAANGQSACGDQPAAVSISTPSLILDPAFGQDTAVVVVSDVSALFAPAGVSYSDQPACLGTALNEGSTGDDIMLFPNPASDQVNITGHGIEHVEIINATGRVMRARSFQAASSVDLDVSRFPRGLYHLRVKTASGWRSEKLILE